MSTVVCNNNIPKQVNTSNMIKDQNSLPQFTSETFRITIRRWLLGKEGQPMDTSHVTKHTTQNYGKLF